MSEAGPPPESESESQSPGDVSMAGAAPAQTEFEAHEITYAGTFYPARPKMLRPRARLREQGARRPEWVREAAGSNPVYVQWLVDQSMLHDANAIARQFAGSGAMWQNPFASPDPRAAVRIASVWFTAYPISLITEAGCSFLAALGDAALWKAFHEIGIDAVHTGPVKKAGGVTGWDSTPSVDGHFDRISTQLDPAFGTEDEFRRLCEVAGEFGGTVIDDIVPGHTGKGADFRLAEMKIGDYPGIYHMVEIDPADWHLLPDVRPGRDSINIDQQTEEQLEKAGYIIGRLQRVIFQDPGIKDTNWSATHAVAGPDGVSRRWVYLHYFKEGQPTINWLDPTFAGMRLVIGDALHSLSDLGAGGLRLDANGFLGVEKSLGGAPAWSEGHPLSEAANQFVASMVRKVGGFTFQELNLTMEDIKATSNRGADLSYDFVTRPAYHHALATGDTEFLRLTMNTALEIGIDPASLIHGLQSHDEVTYELIHFATVHKDDLFSFRGLQVPGAELAIVIREELTEFLTGPGVPYNSIFTTNGIAATTATAITAVLGFSEIRNLTEKQVGDIRRAHLLLAMYNALQPGVFALSGWDLCGMLTLDQREIEALLATGDTRWIQRCAYDLIGYDTSATHSPLGMPRGISLYGTLPDQLQDEGSFASQLKRILAIRERYQIATAHQLDVPQVSRKGMLVAVHDIGTAGDKQVTVLNFSMGEVSGSVRSKHLDPGWIVVDMFTDQVIATVDDLHTFPITLGIHCGTSLLVSPPP
ncbi:MAG: maltose alpha-D-glucosyltransferase [Actinomycetes bacterium]